MTDGTEETLMDYWPVRLAVNLLGYATIFVPGYLLIKYLKKIRYDETAGEYISVDYFYSYNTVCNIICPLSSIMLWLFRYMYLPVLS